MFGYSLCSIHIYGIGPFIEPLQLEFGWSRAQISFGLTISSLIVMVFGIFVGMLVDRIGSRWIALIGIGLLTIAFALFGTASGTVINWILLWIIFGAATLFMLPTVWAKPVASSFNKSLGLAMALALSGSALGAMVFPVLGSVLIAELGWRLAFPTMAGIWGALVLPIVLLGFRSSSDKRAPLQWSTENTQAPTAVCVQPGLTVSEALRSPTFYKLMAVCILSMLATLGIMVHMIPLLGDLGASPIRAAATTSLAGLAALAGRLSTGYLLDQFSGRLVGASVFLFPVVGISLLLIEGSSPVIQYIAAISIGFVLGGEADVIAYLTTRYLGIRNFGVLFAAMGSALALGAAVGPLLAGLANDRWGSYTPFLVMTLALFVLCSLTLSSLGRPRFSQGG